MKRSVLIVIVLGLLLSLINAAAKLRKVSSSVAIDFALTADTVQSLQQLPTQCREISTIDGRVGERVVHFQTTRLDLLRAKLMIYEWAALNRARATLLVEPILTGPNGELVTPARK